MAIDLSIPFIGFIELGYVAVGLRARAELSIPFIGFL